MNIHELQNWSPPWEWMHCYNEQQSGLLRRFLYSLLICHGQISVPLPKEFDYFIAELIVTKVECARHYKWSCKTFFSRSYYCYQGINGALFTEDEPLDIKYLFYRTQVPLFFPLVIVVDGYMNLNWNFPAHKNILTWICTRPCLFSFFLLKRTLRLIKVHKVPCPKNEDYSFCHEQFCFGFSPLHSTFLPVFSAHKVLSP